MFTRCSRRLLRTAHGLLTAGGIAALGAQAIVDATSLTVRVTLPADHRLVTVVVDDAQGVRIRNLFSMQPVERFGGNPTNGLPQTLVFPWDGLDDDGRRAPPDVYTVRGLSLPGLKAVFERSFYNPGTPPWHGYPNSHWGANHGEPVALACVAPGDASTWRTVVTCAMSEGTDFMFAIGKDGRKVYGWQFAWGNSQAVAIESNMLYAAFGDNLRKLEVGTGRVLGWARTAGTVPDNRMPGLIAGIGVGQSQLAVVVDRSEKLPQPALWILDKRTGALMASNTVDRTYRLCAAPDGSVYGVAVDRSEAVRVDWDGTVSSVAWPEVDEPAALAFDREGLAYVMDMGADRQVKVFTPDGDLVRTIGVRGGARDGYRYDPNGLNNLLALAVDDRGFLWTSEGASPRRQAAWDREGRLVESYVGSTFYGAMNCTLHDQDPERAFVLDMMLWSEPAQTQAYRVERFLWSGRREGSPFALENGLPWAFFPRFQYFRSKASGTPREYAVQTSTGYPILYVQQADGDYRPRAAMWAKVDQPEVCPWARPEDPGGTVYVWSDLNGDEQLQAGEIEVLADSAPGGGCGWAFPMPPTLEWFNGGYRIMPARFQADGAPVYELRGFRKLAFEGFDKVATSLDHPPGQPQRPTGFMTRVGSHLFHSVGNWPTYFTGKHLWMDLGGRVIATRRFQGGGVHGSMAVPGPLPDGETLGELFMSGTAPLRKEIGWVMALHGNYGQVYFLTEDGLFISSLFHDARTAPEGWGAEVVRGRDWSAITMYQEAFGGWFGRQADGKYRYVFGHTSANVVQILGFEDVRAFHAGTVTLD